MLAWIALGLIFCPVALIPRCWESAGEFFLAGLTILALTALALAAESLFPLERTPQQEIVQHRSYHS